jgi:hypothetical protein
MSYRDKIHAQRYLSENREEYPTDPWRYVETALAMGCAFTDLNNAELGWFLTEQARIRSMMESWPGLTAYTPEQFAAIDARIDAAIAARDGVQPKPRHPAE